MLKNDTLKNDTSRIGLYGSAPPGFCCLLWLFVPTKIHNEQYDAQMETSTKSQKEQQKAITSNKRHLPVSVFGDRIDSISKTRKSNEEQQQAAKSNKRQRTANGNTHQKPKRATKSNKEHFHSHFHSFAPILDLWKVVDIKSNEKPERATTGNEKQQKATKSNKKQQQTLELEKPKQARKSQDEQRRAQKVQMETRLN